MRALVTTRHGGVSGGPYRSLNLGTRVGDDPAHVAENRARVRAHLPAEPRWLAQVHGARVVPADSVRQPVEADAAYTREPEVVCVVQMADCLPILLCDHDASVVAVAHAGWRGLAGGVVESTLRAIAVPPDRLMAWLGPAIGPAAFEVGSDVRDAFVAGDPGAQPAFVSHRPNKWLADLFALARRRLARAGVQQVYGGGLCTVADTARFFSHRRDRTSGRMGAFIWLAR